MNSHFILDRFSYSLLTVFCMVICHPQIFDARAAAFRRPRVSPSQPCSHGTSPVPCGCAQSPGARRMKRSRCYLDHRSSRGRSPTCKSGSENDGLSTHPARACRGQDRRSRYLDAAPWPPIPADVSGAFLRPVRGGRVGRISSASLPIHTVTRTAAERRSDTYW